MITTIKTKLWIPSHEVSLVDCGRIELTIGDYAKLHNVCRRFVERLNVL